MTTSLMRLGRSLLAWLAVATVVGCVPDSALQAAGAPCIDDTECARFDARYVCVIGVCVDPDNTALDQVHLEVRPLDTSGYHAQQLLDVRATSDDGRTLIELRETVNVHGVLVDDALDVGVPAQVVAVQQHGIPGRALVVTAEADAALGAFSLPLVEHDTYAIGFFPNDSTRPPLPFPGAYYVEPSPTGERALGPVSLPGTDALVRVSGRVTAGEGTAQLGVQGLEVRVLDGKKRVSSVARTDDYGAFQVALPPPALQGALVLEVRPTQANRLNPTVRLDLGPLEGDTEVGDVRLGALQAPVPFTGVVNGPDGQPVPGASVYVSGVVGAGTFSALFSTDEEGAYEAELRPARYDFVVVAPPTYPSAGLLASFSADVGGDAPAPVLNLPERLLASGTVVDDDGQAVGNATVQMTRLSAVGGAYEPLLEGLGWTFTALTDESGAWQQRVDPGRYRVVIVPDASTTRPRLTALIDVDAERTSHRFRLPRSSVVAGVVRGVGNEAMEMATVTAYAPFPAGETGAAIELGSAQTKTDGSFEILLPDLADLERED